MLMLKTPQTSNIKIHHLTVASVRLERGSQRPQVSSEEVAQPKGLDMEWYYRLSGLGLRHLGDRD